MSISTIAIIGAGSGGHAAAAELTLKGFRVHLHDIDPDVVDAILANGGISVSGKIKGFAKIAKVGTDLEELVSEADTIMPMVPRFAHGEIGLRLAPLVTESQDIFLNPGSTGGGLEFSKILREKGKKKTTVSTTATLPYAARLQRPGEVDVFLKTKTLFFASFPGRKTREKAQRLRALYSSIEPVTNVLEVSLNNGNPITHPFPTLLNAARIENTQGDFLFYRQGISPSVASINERLDHERMGLCRVLGFPEISATERLYRLGYTDKLYPTLLEAYQKSDAFAQIMAPKSLDHRYILEDVPFGLVFFASLGKLLGVPVETMKKVVDLASLIRDRDFWNEGLTMKALGLDLLTKTELTAFLDSGESEEVSW